jgi:rod shape-determining protein MreD
MFILFLPVNFSKSLVLFLSALMGFCIDLFSGELGLHMAACTLTAYVRPYLLKRISTSDELEIPPINKIHFGQYLIYTGTLVILHHLLLFSLETFNLRDIFFVVTRTLLSAVFNIILIGLARVVVTRI